MAFDCARYQVDAIAGDGNRAYYLATPKAGGIPTYECSLLQYWINKTMNVATQSRRKHFGNCPPVRVKHFISCSYRDLGFLATHLDGITTDTYTAQHAKKTEARGDCCMLSIAESGHARLEYEEDVGLFDDQDQMDFIGAFAFRVNETCLTSDHKIFMVAPTDRDAHNPILIHLRPSDMIWKERRAYVRKEKRKATQKSNKRKGRRWSFSGRVWKQLG